MFPSDASFLGNPETRYTSEFLLAMVMGFFKNVALPARGENHPRTGDATIVYFVAKSSAHCISRDFFLQFFQLSRHLRERGCTCD